MPERATAHCLSVMLYGSRARGDADADSDIDLLCVASTPMAHVQRGRTSITTYTIDQLTRMCEAGALFARHLALEGRILRDTDGTLSGILAMYRDPPSYGPLLGEVAYAARILDAPAERLRSNVVGFTRLGLYLLRTAAIVLYCERFGEVSFSLPQIASALNEPRLLIAFAGRDRSENLDESRLALVKELIEGMFLKEPIVNEDGSLEALAINAEGSHPTVSRLALRMIAGERTLGYGDLFLDPLVPLHE